MAENGFIRIEKGNARAKIKDIYIVNDVKSKIDLMFNDMALSSFLSKHRIGDLHEGNFGFIGDRTVIIDFSGYMG